MTPKSHEDYMEIAYKQAETAAQAGEVPTGCIIVNQQHESDQLPVVIGRAHNQTELLKDPTAHAEMIAITQATGALAETRLTNSVLYVTKEPCAMCAGAIVLARIPLVVFGTADPARGGAVSIFQILDNPNLNHRCEIIQGVLDDKCRAILQNFFKEKRAKRTC